MDIVRFIFRILASLVGAAAVYTALFMYEDEEGKWQNRIEDLWIAADDRSRLVGSKSVALCNNIARIVTKGLNRVFGNRLLSLRSVGASTSYSFSTILILVFFVQFGKPLPHQIIIELSFFTAFILFSAVGPTVFPTRWFQPISLSTIAFVLFYFYADWSVGGLHTRDPLILAGGLSLSFVSDVLLIILVRYTL